MSLIKKTIFVLYIVLFANVCSADFVKVTLLGTGSPRPSVDRSGPAVLVEAGGETLLFDAGRGVVQRMQQLDVGSSDIQHIFLTHLHSDHISAVDDVWLTGWIYQRPEALNIYGPKGTVSFIDHLTQAYSFDVHLRNKHAGLGTQSGLIHATNIKPGVVYSENGVKVTAFLVNHKPVDPAYGYRIDFGKRSVVISGDTSFSQSLADHSNDVDLLVHEIMAVKPEILERNPRLQKIERYHTDPAQLAQVLKLAKPRVAVMTHIILVGISEQEVLDQIQSQFDGELYMGEDLMSIEVGSRVKVIPYSIN
ncbi:MAG: MBL fold metallo-hydrolase [Pseudomonadota bacterium]